ncbi:MAG: hypothetical protein LBT84_01190 [Spirochaetia bacterium]|nr:hypothetical protein [Spirochaetia bacterium]
MKVNFLLCDDFKNELTRDVPSYESLFFTLFDQISPGAVFKIFDVRKNEYPSNIEQDELCLIPGSHAGAYEKHQWVQRLLDFVKQAHSRKAKLLGVCFGHQLIAQALGGNVAPAAGWGGGLRESNVKFTDNAFPQKKIQLLYNHNDQVTKLPAGAKLIAESAFCPFEGFTLENIVTLQGHPEYTIEYCRHLIENYSLDKPEAVRAAALKSIASGVHDGVRVTAWALEQLGF